MGTVAINYFRALIYGNHENVHINHGAEKVQIKSTITKDSSSDDCTETQKRIERLRTFHTPFHSTVWPPLAAHKKKGYEPFPRRPSRSHDEQSTHLIDGDPTNREAVRLGESSVLNLDAQSIFSAVAQSDFGSTLPDSVCRLIAHFGDFIVDSHILNCDEQGDLLTLLEEQFVNRANVELRVLYRGSRDGFRIQPFLNKAKDKENTLMLIHNDHHYKFGGYTQIPWSDDREYHSDETAFLYQIRPQCTVFPLLPEREHWAVMHDTSQSTFPFFGNWGELVLYQDCNLNSNSNCFIWDGRETFDFKANDVCGGNTHPHGPKYWGFRVIEVELLQII